MPAADHDPHCTRSPSHERLDRAAIDPRAGSLTHPADFGRQRPSLTGEPAGTIEHIPVDAGWTGAAHRPVIGHSPSKGRDVCAALWIDQGEIGSARIGKEPDRRLASSAPVVHETEPFIASPRLDD